ncbi:hypothetical protein ABW20_dc0107313 [Dactylellina cionopaga]|nr:hypothetical protein ABW20_dc0107313 [Dactylellina cionopaga]
MYDKSLLLYARAYDLIEDHTSISPLSFIRLPSDTDEEVIDTSALLSNLSAYLPANANFQLSGRHLEATKDVGSLLSNIISLRDYKEQPDEFYAWDRRNEIVEDIAGDKMVIDRRALEYLKKMVKAPVFDETIQDEDNEEIETNKRMNLTTPPLSPLLFPTRPPSPISLENLAETLEPLLLIDETSLLDSGLENSILHSDVLQETPRTIKILQEIQNPPPITPSPAKRPFRELHIEVPLTPPLTSPSKNPSSLDIHGDIVNGPIPSSPFEQTTEGPFKRVRFSDIVEEFLLPPSLDPSDSENEAVENPTQHDLLTQSAMAEFTLEVMEPGAQYFLMQLQQEELEDSTKLGGILEEGLRVSLPIVNWQRPVPPWVSGRALGDKLKDKMDKKVMECWDYRKSLDIAGLQWTIGDHTIINNAAQETLFPSNEEDLWETITDLFPALPLETTLEEEEEIILENELSEGDTEELECAKIEPKMDLDSLVEQKRSKTSYGITNKTGSRKSLLDPKNNLSSFLSLQSRILQQPDEAEIQTPSNTPLASESPRVTSLTKPSAAEPLTHIAQTLFVDFDFTVIISASFLVNRALYKIIRSLCPSATFVERDFDSSMDTVMFGSEDQVPDEPAIEADLLVSPLVGLIITNLQTIRQRPLPSTSSSTIKIDASFAKETKGGIRDRIVKVSERYHRLVVGVSVGFGGNGGEYLELGKADCAILSGFIGFCEAIGNIQVVVIRDSDTKKETGNWIAGVMGFYSRRWRGVGMAVKITERESSWEAYLRHAGINSYAAQAILTKLGESECRLVDFVTIEKESRKAIFEQFVGRKVLEKFEEIVGAEWQGA